MKGNLLVMHGGAPTAGINVSTYGSSDIQTYMQWPTEYFFLIATKSMSLDWMADFYTKEGI